MHVQRGPRALWRRPAGLVFIRNWGDVSALAALCDVTPQAVSIWKRVPARHVDKVATYLGTTPGHLRPDLALRYLMSKDMDPRDAAKAEEKIARAIAALDEKRLKLAEARLAESEALTALRQAQLLHDRAVVGVKRARDAASSLRKAYLAAGVPEDRLGWMNTSVLGFPSSASGSAEVGGVEA